MKVGERVVIDTTRFGSGYAVGKPPEMEGVIESHGKGGLVKVRYDFDGQSMKSHWNQLRPATNCDAVKGVPRPVATTATKPWHPIEAKKPEPLPHSKFIAFRKVLCGYRTFEELMNSNAEKTAEIRRLCAHEFRLLDSISLDGHSLERYI